MASNVVSPYLLVPPSSQRQQVEIRFATEITVLSEVVSLLALFVEKNINYRWPYRQFLNTPSPHASQAVYSVHPGKTATEVENCSSM